MLVKEAVALSKRSEHWLRNHECSWCQQTLMRALVYGCGAIYEKCDPSKKNFADNAMERRRVDVTTKRNPI